MTARLIDALNVMLAALIALSFGVAAYSLAEVLHSHGFNPFMGDGM